MKLAYICSPYKAPTKKAIQYNIWKAEYISKKVYEKGLIPICVHTFLERTTGLHEVKGDRKELLKIGREIIKMCEYIIINKDHKTSEGMKAEIRTAKQYGLNIIYYKQGQMYINKGD